MICSLKEIVLSVQSAVPDNWQVSWLIDPRITSAFPNKTLFSGLLKHIFRCVSYVHCIRVSEFFMQCAPWGTSSDVSPTYIASASADFSCDVLLLGSVLPNHSDEIVQELHLFPFSPVETHLKMCLSWHQLSFPYETFPILAHSAFVYNNVLQNQRIKHSDHCKCHAGISGQCK